MATSQVDFANPQLTTVYTDFLDYIRNNINAVAQMNYTGALSIPVGVIQWNDTTKIFEKWGGSSWSEIYTGFPAGFTMLAVQNSAPTGWVRKTLSCQDNAMFCYAKTGNTAYGGSVNPQATHSHDIAGHTHTTTNHQHSMAVHSHTLNSHVHGMNSHIHGMNSHSHDYGDLWAAIGIYTDTFTRLGLKTKSTSSWSTTKGGDTMSTLAGKSVSEGVYVYGDTGSPSTPNTETPSTANTETPSTANTGSGGTTVTASAGADTTSGSNEANTGSNTAPYYQEVIAIEKS